MDSATPTAEVNIHLRARAGDRDLIDQAADLLGTNRSQFMLSAALKDAKNVMLDQTTIRLDARAFQQLLDDLDRDPSPDVQAGIQRLLANNVFTTSDRG